jgi:hypothetical protein
METEKPFGFYLSWAPRNFIRIAEADALVVHVSTVDEGKDARLARRFSVSGKANSWLNGENEKLDENSNGQSI